ncbi:hypothetical protein K3G63_00680 [Hymenobacter sp. HSC-4F20]|uniref:hypothetical protein n=1 Tax=Hymenobacter sp. HSC-4F20 TaxID=2864135 RepID=UPI001C72B3B3|nr:hypothetical protein [Hymenobacter sp. HSC-4F20]MBX0288929.1 hypothetical protein [Hymenobacter sp. HSC-4F20]
MLLIYGVSVAAPSRSLGQAAPLPLPEQLKAYARQNVTEKLFLHLDQPTYLSGETLWFKVYAVEGTRHTPAALSKVAYVELLNERHQPVAQVKVALHHGAGQGSVLLPRTLASGTYTVRAYTNWMRNAGPAFYFQQPVTVITPSRLPVSAASAAGPDRYDVQFFPEGGSLVQGVRSTVGFMVTDPTGRGLDAKGVVLDQQGHPVGSLSTLRCGIGSFTMLPAVGAGPYSAVITLPTGLSLTRQLPAALSAGYSLHLADTSATALTITVTAKGPDTDTVPVTLLGHARQHPFVFTTTSLLHGQAVFTIPKPMLPEGITHFTVFNQRRQPVAERLYFRPPARHLGLVARTSQPRYGTRQKVTLHLSTTASGQRTAPVQASVAVYRLDSLSASVGPDINSVFWLTSDLKGTVEQPAYYLGNSPAAAAAADNLMLTHGWSRFRWTDVLTGTPLGPAYAAETNGLLVRGRVTHRLTGAAAPGIITYLSVPGRQIRLYVDQSAADGSVEFEVPAHYGPKDIVLQTNTQTDSLYQVELLPAFAPAAAAHPSPLSPLAAALLPSLTRRYIQAQVRQAYFQPLTEGRLAARPTSADSVAFYGQPNERYLLDSYTRFPTMEEVLREYVPGVQVRGRKDGFHLRVLDKVNGTVFNENPLVLLDGVPVFNMNQVMALDPLKVQRLDVVTSRYALGPLLAKGLVSLTTYRGNLDGLQLPAQTLLQEYETLQWEREFYAPRYDLPQEKQSPLADLRQLLHWQPTVRIDATGQAQLEFYTSDQTGRYRVEAHGLASDGTAGSSSFTFDVLPAQ